MDILIPCACSSHPSPQVVGGKNAAYDTFPSQVQIFYPGKGKNVIW